MGTIEFSEYNNTGSKADEDAPIAKLDTFVYHTEDATTSTSAESVTMNANTKLVSVYAVEKHRISTGSDTTGTAGAYDTIQAGERRDFGIDPETILYYRSDA